MRLNVRECMKCKRNYNQIALLCVHNYNFNLHKIFHRLAEVE